MKILKSLNLQLPQSGLKELKENLKGGKQTMQKEKKENKKFRYYIFIDVINREDFKHTKVFEAFLKSLNIPFLKVKK